MKKLFEKDFLKSDRAKLIMAIALNLVILAIMLFCFEVRYEENDDLTVQKFLDGQTAEKSAFVIYINYFLALLIKGLYSICGNSLPMFPLFQYALLFVSFTGISYALYKKLPVIAASAASVALLSFFGADSYLIMTYTKTAGISTVGGLSLMLLALEEKGGVKKWLPLVLGALLLILSSMLRDKEFIVCLALMFPLGLYALIKHAQAAGKGQRIKAACRFALPFVLVLVLVGGFFAANVFIWDNSDHYDYKVYNTARSRFGDYGVPKYNELPEVYDSLDIDENALILLNCYDTKKFTAASFDTISDARDSQLPRLSIGECVGRFLDHCLASFFIQRHIYGLMALLILWLAAGKRDWLSFICWGGSFALFGLLYIFLIYQGRYLVNRTDSGFFFALAVTLAWLLDGEKLKNEKLLCLGLAGLCLVWGYRQNREYCYFNSENILMDDSFQKAAIEQLIEDEHLFLTEIDSINHSLYSPLETVPAGYGDSLVLLGDWVVQHPKTEALLADYGVVNPYEDIVDNERVYLIAYDVELSIEYIRTYYAPDARAEKVEPLSSRTGLEIYRILSH